MDGSQFVVPDGYVGQAAVASGGAQPATGMAPYPLYGIPPLGQDGNANAVPFYREAWFGTLVGAAVVGAAWAYFGWWRKRAVESNTASLDSSELGSVLSQKERQDCAELWSKERLSSAERQRLREYERRLRQSPG